ncbi:hypothetical protein TCAL_10889 [Tigriopus californicus]|uniref:Ras-associating domain-containing protein n=3 Tax=Tigriopus californicus TaxID=6832 RepID=A0A553NBV0_TIGCA|nr:hypothetical protein TCAL_10889 [Tigriopus californicus]
MGSKSEFFEESKLRDLPGCSLELTADQRDSLLVESPQLRTTSGTVSVGEGKDRLPKREKAPNGNETGFKNRQVPTDKCDAKEVENQNPTQRPNSVLPVTPLLVHLLKLGLASADLQNERSKTSPSVENDPQEISRAAPGTNNAERQEPSNLGQSPNKLENLTDWTTSDLDIILKELESIQTHQGKEGASVQKECPTLKNPASDVNLPKPNIVSSSSMPSFNVGMACTSAQTSSNSNGNGNGGGGGVSKGKGSHGGRIESPDNDSAFSDNASMLSSESSSSGMSGSKKGAGIGGVQPQLQSLHQQPTQASLVAENKKLEDGCGLTKAKQINLALEKLTTAELESGCGALGGGPFHSLPGAGDAAKKLFVKFFCADGSTKSILVDGAMCVGDILDILIEKNHVQPEPSWGLVEHIPELYMERCLEDHENMFAILGLWRPEAKNKILFVPRTERYDLFRRPERYLLGIGPRQKSSQEKWDQDARQSLLHEVFFQDQDLPHSSNNGDPNGSAEIEGPLWIKSEGKKTWKKYYFILRQSGLYHVARGKKPIPCPEKDLIPVVPSFGPCQVYQGVGWKKKFKSPTDFTLAVKPPHIQVKSPKHIRYICAESEIVLQQWYTMIRILKNKKQMLENYNLALAKMQIGTGKEELRQELLLQKATGLASHFQDPGTYSQQQNDPINPRNVTGDSRLTASGSHGGSNSEQNSFLAEDQLSDTCCHAQRQLDGSLTSTNGTSSSGGSMPSSSNTSISSGCVSETSSVSENGFDADFHDGGTIKRKPGNAHGYMSAAANFSMDEDDDDDDPDGEDRTTPTPGLNQGSGFIEMGEAMRRPNLSNMSKEGSLPPPPKLEDLRSMPTANIPLTPTLSNLQRSGSDMSLNSLPPPPEELKFPLRYPLGASGVINSHHLILPQASVPGSSDPIAGNLFKGSQFSNFSLPPFNTPTSIIRPMSSTTGPSCTSQTVPHQFPYLQPQAGSAAVYGSPISHPPHAAAVAAKAEAAVRSVTSSCQPLGLPLPQTNLHAHQVRDHMATSVSTSTYMVRTSDPPSSSTSHSAIPTSGAFMLQQSQRNFGEATNHSLQSQIGAANGVAPRLLPSTSLSSQGLVPTSTIQSHYGGPGFVGGQPNSMASGAGGMMVHPTHAYSAQPQGTRSDGNDGEEATRDQLYPCGVFRAVHPSRNPLMLDQEIYPSQPLCHHEQPIPVNANSTMGSQPSQMDLLKRLPNSAPPKPFNGGPVNSTQPQALHENFMASTTQRLNEWNQAYSQQAHMASQNPASVSYRRKRITFDEVVLHINLNSSEPLKSAPNSSGAPDPNPEPTTSWLHVSGEPFPTPCSSVRNPHPGRLFEAESQQAKDTPPRAFLNDLQRVMKKKWSVAQRFHHTTPQPNSTKGPATVLKNKEEIEAEQEQAERFANHYNERDVSKWILQSLKHSHIQETDMSQDLMDCHLSSKPQSQVRLVDANNALCRRGPLEGSPSLTAACPSSVPPSNASLALAHQQRPKIYNGRSVPNCFPPTSIAAPSQTPLPPFSNLSTPTPNQYYMINNNTVPNLAVDDNSMYGTQHLMPSSTTPSMGQSPALARPNALVLGKMPPAPPRRSMKTHLTSPR